MVNMNASKNTTKQDMEKYTKFLALKAVQIIIQSRLGKTISTPCKPQRKNNDWFNLNIIDTPEVLNQTKQICDLGLLQAFVPLCVEISLKTSEGDVMVLETWCLSLLPEILDPKLDLKDITPSIYDRLGILLKSLVSVTRVTPAYKVSRRQSADSFILRYRMYMGEPQVLCLGEGYRQVRIGLIASPVGTIQLSVFFRTKMTISPTQSGRKNSIMLKSDHFNSHPNPRKLQYDDDINDLSKPMRAAPFADPLKAKKSEQLIVEPEIPGVTRLLALGKYKSRPVKETNELSDISNAPADETESDKTENNSQSQNENDAKLLKVSNESKTSNSSSSILKPIDQEFWMKELNAPFASRGPVGDLMTFYRDFEKSPQLHLQQQPSTIAQQQTATEINTMLEMYESQLPEYDALVESFCQQSLQTSDNS